MNPSAASSADWSVPRGVTSAAGTPIRWPGPADITSDWRPLAQTWRDAPEPNFNPGWALLRWSGDGLDVTAIFLGRNQSNRARKLNDRTWELGDIFEFFLQADGCPRYVELHVTPENHRLQLLWPPGGLEEFRAGRARLEDFTVSDPAWVRSAVHMQPAHWAIWLHIPLARIGLPTDQKPERLRACVCRYDLSHGAEVLSSTAPLREPNYHRVGEWSRLRLLD